ncbi:MAG: hypothetical protein HZC28_13015 [Spirochaetes bacterium]|nr:hypothetical protein [Spirochaetota bacterium]
MDIPELIRNITDEAKSFVTAYRPIFIAGALTVFIITLTLGIMLNRKKSNGDATIPEQAVNDSHAVKEKNEERLLSAGLILSTKDMTPPEKIRRYNRVDSKNLTVDTTFFQDDPAAALPGDGTTSIKETARGIRSRTAEDNGLTRKRTVSNHSWQPKNMKDTRYDEPVLP